MKQKLILSICAFVLHAPILAVESQIFQQAVPANQLPLGLPVSEMEKIKETGGQYTTIENMPEKIQNFHANYNAAKNALLAKRNNTNVQASSTQQAVYQTVAAIKLAFKAAHIPNATLHYVIPAGTQVNGQWTGVERFFEIAGIGQAKLLEYDLSANKGKFYMLKSAINTRVNGNEAIARVFSDQNGQTLDEVVWVSGSKFYMLSLLPIIKTIGITQQTHRARIVSIAHGIN